MAGAVPTMIGRRRYHLYWPGVVFILLTVLIGAACLQRRENLLVWIFASMLAWIVVSGFVSGGMMMAIRVRRTAPRSARVGELMRVGYEVSSNSRFWPIFDLKIIELAPGRLSEAFMKHCSPLETVVVDLGMRPQQRGRLALARFRCLSGFPLGLIVKSVEFADNTTILVHPRISRLRTDTLQRLLAGRGGEGRRVFAARGGGDEFHSLRDYHPGDPLRSVAWRRSTTLRGLVVVNRSAPVPRRLSIALDLRGANPAHSIQDEEQAIAMTASLLQHAEQSGWEISLEVLGFHHQQMRLRRGGRHLLHILDLLAEIDLQSTRLQDGTHQSRRLGEVVTIVPGGQRNHRDAIGVTLCADAIAEFIEAVAHE